MTCPFGTGNNIYFVGPGFECAHKVERIDSTAARHGEKPYSITQLPFKSASVDVLIWVYLLTKKDRNIESGAFLVHDSPFAITKNSVYTLFAGIDAHDGNLLSANL